MRIGLYVCKGIYNMCVCEDMYVRACMRVQVCVRTYVIYVRLCV